MASRLGLPAAMIGAALALAGCGGSNDTAGSTETTPTVIETTPAVTTGTAPPVTTTEATPAPTRTTVTLRVVGGKPEGGIARPKVKKGEKVLLVVRSDTADEVHLHGYDISREISAGRTARIAFVAKIPGRFEVELEHSGVQLAELTVQ